uniref:Uncharacterized protein n=1 Tax=Arundo donax TaxID=35708 RepID=A0A0A9ATP3_ARUDO
MAAGNKRGNFPGVGLETCAAGPGQACRPPRHLAALFPCISPSMPAACPPEPWAPPFCAPPISTPPSSLLCFSLLFLPAICFGDVLSAVLNFSVLIV